MFAEAFAEANEVGLSETKKASHSEVKRQARNDQYAEHDAPITLDDVRILRSIIEAHNGQRMSINDFTSEDIQKAQKWAYKFYKELNVKSPFFRAWFGDWRAYDNNTDVYFVDTKQDNRGSVVNDYTGWNIQTSKKVHKETSHHSGSPEVTAVKYLPYIDDITKKAVLFDSIISDKENENSLMFHTMYAYTEVLGYPALLKIKVEELFYHNRETSGILKRDYILQNIEEESISKRNRFSRPNHSETNSSNMSISDLFALVKQYDKDFKPKLVHESMIENGKPKVFYHGTNAEFTEFDRKKARYGLYGKVFYFTDSESNAKNYGNTMPVYLDVKAPLEPNKTEVTTAQIKKFLQTVAENEDYDIYNYGTDNVDKVLDMITSRDAFAVIQDINSTAIGDFVEAIKLWNEVNGSSFDGIVTPTETVVFEPEQIKSATYSEDLSGPTDNIGTFDRGQKDIRYSERNTDSSRMLLANALESAATNSAEAARLALYKENIAKYDGKQDLKIFKLRIYFFDNICYNILNICLWRIYGYSYRQRKSNV